MTIRYTYLRTLLAYLLFGFVLLLCFALSHSAAMVDRLKLSTLHSVARTGIWTRTRGHVPLHFEVEETPCVVSPYILVV